MLKNDIVQWIKDWFDENGPNSPAVIGISGGVDSTVVAALCVEALGKDRVQGVLLPNGTQSDLVDSFEVCQLLGIEHSVYNIKYTYDSFDMFDHPDSVPGSESMALARGNTEARIRMTYLYGLSQTINGRVSNNCNKSEIYVGYSTRWGDDTGDFAPLRDLVKEEVYLLAEELGLPHHLARKVPIDGLENNRVDGVNRTDEDSMGFSYQQLDDYILARHSSEQDTDELIRKRHENSRFKRLPIAQYTKGETI